MRTVYFSDLKIAFVCSKIVDGGWELFSSINFVWMEKSFKGALDNFSLIPKFKKKSWDFYIIRSVYLCSECMLNLTCSFNSVTKIYAFFFQ